MSTKPANFGGMGKLYNLYWCLPNIHWWQMFGKTRILHFGFLHAQSFILQMIWQCPFPLPSLKNTCLVELSVHVYGGVRRNSCWPNKHLANSYLQRMTTLDPVKGRAYWLVMTLHLLLRSVMGVIKALTEAPPYRLFQRQEYLLDLL